MFSLARWNTPFTLQNLGEFVSPADLSASTGEIIVVRTEAVAIQPIPGAAHPIGGLVSGLRRLHPGSPVVLWMPPTEAQAMIDGVRAATRAQVRAILGGDSPDPQLLRAQLTDPLALSSFVLRWASDAGYLPQSMEQHDVRALLDAPPDVRTLDRLARNRDAAARTWRTHLQRLGLPNPRSWLALAHALHVAFYVQRHHTESVEAIAHQLGLNTVANMNRQFRRVFGVSPASVREALGAEPLLHRWFQQRVGR